MFARRAIEDPHLRQRFKAWDCFDELHRLAAKRAEARRFILAHAVAGLIEIRREECEADLTPEMLNEPGGACLPGLSYVEPWNPRAASNGRNLLRRAHVTPLHARRISKLGATNNGVGSTIFAIGLLSAVDGFTGTMGVGLPSGNEARKD